MALRRKQKSTERAKLDATPPWEVRVREELPPTEGPYDEKDAPDDDVPRADLGALRIPVLDEMDLRVEVDESQQVLSATLVRPEGNMQLGVFAAPRNEGIWDEVREEIAESMREQRGRPTERAEGAFGTELTGTLPGDGGRVPVRFIGVDGPRWFLRAMMVGAPADPEQAEVFEQVLRQIVVVRGNEPLPVREPVPLTLPKEVVLPDAGEADADDPDAAE